VQHYREVEEGQNKGGFVFKLGRASEVLGVDFRRFQTDARDLGDTSPAQEQPHTIRYEQPHTIRYEHPYTIRY
jgi:hypothetical protein